MRLVVYMHMRMHIEDYARWKAVFDSMRPTRGGAGATGDETVLRNVDDANDLTVVIGWSDLDALKRWQQSPLLRDAFQRAGVVGAPESRILEAPG